MRLFCLAILFLLAGCAKDYQEALEKHTVSVDGIFQAYHANDAALGYLVREFGRDNAFSEEEKTALLRSQAVILRAMSKLEARARMGPVAFTRFVYVFEDVREEYLVIRAILIEHIELHPEYVRIIFSLTDQQLMALIERGSTLIAQADAGADQVSVGRLQANFGQILSALQPLLGTSL
jgi:hypothetical protein